MPVGMCWMRMADSVLLMCWPPAPEERKVVNFQILASDLDVAVVVDFGHDLQRGEGGMAAFVRIERGDADEAVHPLFRFEIPVGVFPFDFEVDALDARFVAVEAVKLR